MIGLVIWCLLLFVIMCYLLPWQMVLFVLIGSFIIALMPVKRPPR